MINISAQQINTVVGETIGCVVEYIGIEVDEFLKRKNPLSFVFIKKDCNGNWNGVTSIKNEFLVILIKTKTNALTK